MNELEFLTPSFKKVVIREQNGADEGIISKGGQSKLVHNFKPYLKAIVSSYDGSPLTNEAFDKMPHRDKYYILIVSRKFSIGVGLEMSYKFNSEKEPTFYKQDLDEFIWDFSSSNSFPKPGEKGYFETLIPPYSLINSMKESNGFYWHEFTIPSGKTLKFHLLTNGDEYRLLEIGDTNVSILDEYTSRDLQYKTEEGWIKVSDFEYFTSKDMKAIRAEVTKFDDNITMLASFPNPVEGEPSLWLPILSQPDFFF